MLLGRSSSALWLRSLKIVCGGQNASVVVSKLWHTILCLDTQLRTGNFILSCSQSPLADGQTLLGGKVLCALAGLSSEEE